MTKLSAWGLPSPVPPRRACLSVTHSRVSEGILKGACVNMCHTKRRIFYFLIFLVLLAIEVYIALFVRDAFIRPYGGDLLVTVLLCCLCRAVLPQCKPALPVFLLAAVVEWTQWLGLVEMLGLQGTVFAILMGTSFSWIDLLCYGAGCLLFAGAELLWKHLPKK